MDAKELKSGNLVFNLGVLHAIDTLDIYMMDNDSTVLQRFKPIPLTKEWLLKLGALSKVLDNGMIDYKILLNYNSGYKDYIVLRDLTSDRSLVLSIFLENNTNGFFQLPIKIKYLHELQNLIFALTGTELKLKEYEGKSNTKLEI